MNFNYGKKPKKSMRPIGPRPIDPDTGKPITDQKLRLNNAAHHAAERAGTLKPKYGALKVNNVAGNPRQGSSYRVGYDDDGTELHLYGAEAGGIPREIVKVPGPKASFARVAAPGNPKAPTPPKPRKKRRQLGDAYIG